MWMHSFHRDQTMTRFHFRRICSTFRFDLLFHFLCTWTSIFNVHHNTVCSWTSHRYNSASHSLCAAYVQHIIHYRQPIDEPTTLSRSRSTQHRTIQSAWKHNLTPTQTPTTSSSRLWIPSGWLLLSLYPTCVYIVSVVVASCDGRWSLAPNSSKQTLVWFMACLRRLCNGMCWPGQRAPPHK